MSGGGLGLALLGAVGWGRILGCHRPPQSIFRLFIEALAAQAVVSTLVSVALVSGGVYRPVTALALAAVVPIALGFRRGLAPWPGLPGTPLATRPETITVLVLVLVAPVALPRMALLYMENDAGIYSNRAIHHLYEGSLRGQVPARQRLDGDLLQAFDRDNFYAARPDGGGTFLQGTYGDPGDASRFVFQFYPGWPMLMAQWGGLFGLSAMFYVVLFVFSMAVLFFGFLLESRGLGVLAFTSAVALFASSPLLLYFSKYTTSEAALLFLFLFVLHFFIRGGTFGATLAAVGFLAIVVTHISVFLYAPLLFLVALHGYLVRDRRIAAFAAVSFCFMLAGIPLGLFFSRSYFLRVYYSSFRLLGVEDPLRVGLALVVIAYVGGLALSVAGWWRAGRKSEPWDWGERGARLFRVAIPLILVALAVGIVYRSYQLGWTDHFIPKGPIGGAWGARRAYAGTGWGGLAHANIVSMLMATSLGGLPLVLLVAFRRGAWVCASGFRAFLLAAVVLCLFIFTFIRFDTPFNYYASRYFIPVLVPSVMLLFGELSQRADVRRAGLVALVLVGMGFNIWFLVPLYGYPTYVDEMRFVEEVASRVGRNRTLFIRHPKRDHRMAQKLLALPLLHAHGITVINVVEQPDVGVDEQILEYAAGLKVRDAAILCRRPPLDGSRMEAVTLIRGHFDRGILYPRGPVRRGRERYYLYNVAFW